MVEEYVAWHDRHLDPDWQDVLLAPPDTAQRTPGPSPRRAVAPTSSAWAARSRRPIFLSRRQHHPRPGLWPSDRDRRPERGRRAQRLGPEQIARAEAYRELIAETGRFLTFCGGAAPIGYRLRADPAERAALKLVRETDAGHRRHRPDRHAHQPVLCRGRLCRLAERVAARRARGELCRAVARRASRRCAARSRARDAEPVPRAALQPLRRARRPAVARRCADPVGARVPRRADRPSRSRAG